ncbi:DNA polymerase III subunit gamma/tau [Patescibacteria group bacterium]|nr:DNA polymerase III subunit gamma/tau [Patescibacteria group bacterium]
MESKTYYLKYRPQKVFDLDLADVRESLQKILKSKKIPHAFLFSGPKGTGKTSAARIIAKTINCVHKKHKEEPCNRCDICQEITIGNSLDLIEIDAASNRGIDDIRSLREKIKLSPAKCQYKVYIIDEAHMLTAEAFNALLKTLEEPPAHAVFILCTTEEQKIPKTILSRCFQTKFRRSKFQEVIRSLQRVVKGEKLLPGKGVLEAIAQNADGSFRDAQKILDQLSSTGAKISLLETQKLLGQIEELKPEKLLQFLAVKDLKASFLEIDRLVNFGADLEVYLQKLLEKLRLILLKLIGVEINNGQETELIDNLDKSGIIRLINLFSRAATEMKATPIPQLPLELVAVEWCEDSPLKADVERGHEVSQGDFNSASTSLVEKESLSKDLPSPSPAETPPNSSTSSPTKGNLNKIVEKWNDLLLGIKPLNHSVEALLRAARPIKMDNGFLTLEVFYKFHKERLETERCRLIVEEVASQLLGKPIKLKCILGEKKKETFPKEPENDIMEIASEIFNGKLID